MADQSRQNRSSLLRRFARAQRGAAAVEFAIVAIPFLMLVFAIIELGLVFLVSMTLENALVVVDRRIRTGEFTGDQQLFQTEVCQQMSWLEAACPSAISLDVRTVLDVAKAGDLAPPLPGQSCWRPGGENSIVLVRGYYKWPVITPLLQDAVDSSGGDRVISFAHLFTSEPYGGAAPPSNIKCPDEPQ